MKRFILNPAGTLIAGLLLGMISRLSDIYKQNLGNVFFADGKRQNHKTPRISEDDPGNRGGLPFCRVRQESIPGCNYIKADKLIEEFLPQHDAG